MRILRLAAVLGPLAIATEAGCNRWDIEWRAITIASHEGNTNHTAESNANASVELLEAQ